MKKVRKKISADDFVKLWDNIAKKNWDKVMPDFWDETKKGWTDEIRRRFTQMKKGGSYGNVNDFVLKTLLQNTEQTFLPRTASYGRTKYAEKYPMTYVKTGYLKRVMDDASSYQEIREADKIGVKVNIPMRLSFSGRTSGGDYTELEEKRSFVKSSFVLAWPKILQKVLESIGN